MMVSQNNPERQVYLLDLGYPFDVEIPAILEIDMKIRIDTGGQKKTACILRKMKEGIYSSIENGH